MVLVTGASGFVGSALCRALRALGTGVIEAVRQAPGPGQVGVGDLGPDTDWRAALAGCDSVVHLAARVHVMADPDSDPLQAYRTVNVDGTIHLARQAVAAGVRRFVFVSSVKVNGEATTGRPFRADDVPAPVDPYGQSKCEAEAGLRALAAETGIEVVIVRPPLVYGPGVKANFLNLIRLVRRGLPLPLGSIANRRSMVALDNLVDLLMVCTTHPQAPGHTFMVSDGHDLSIADLIRMIANALGTPPRLVPVPAVLLMGGARLFGKGAVADRLMGSLQVDLDQTRSTLQWSPIVAPQAAINQTVKFFLAAESVDKV
jgi:nucleoside-diphosphate-sugar epimerase